MEELRYRSVFDIIGPVMIGPSSSHTAGSCPNREDRTQYFWRAAGLRRHLFV
jgi:L-serine deaminase